jgi:hypothetical protein
MMQDNWSVRPGQCSGMCAMTCFSWKNEEC